MNWRLGVAGLICAAMTLASEGRGIVKFGGLPLPGATIVASRGENRVVAVSGEDGSYLFRDLADGVWNERVEMPGFEPQSQDVNVGPGAPGPVWELKMLGLEELRALAPAAPPASAAPAVTYTVTPPPAENKPAARGKKANAKAGAPATPPESGFQRTDVTASTARGSAQDAPPGPADSGPASPGDSTDSFAINGSANNGAASNFALSPAFGNNRRGPGSLYNGNFGATLGNSALNARPFSITGQDTPKAAYNHLQANVALGGPVRIPHVFFGNTPPNFFVAYQLVRNRNADTIPWLVPTVDQRNGILGPDYVIPQSQLSPQALALLQFYPLPNFTGSSRYNYQTAIRSISNSDNLQSRLGKAFGRSNQVFGTFAWQSARGASTSVFGFEDTNSASGIDLTLNWTHRFNQRVFGTFKYQFNRLSTRSTPYFANRRNVSGEAGITGNDQDPLNWGPPGLNFSSGIATLSDAIQSFNRSQTHAAGFNVFWSHSPHNITFGADIKRQQFNDLGQQNPRGDFTFTGAATGSDFADFLLGVPDTSSIAFGNADKYFRASIYDAYITDDWRLTPSFTFNAGVRWEYTSPISEKYGRLVNLDIANGFANEMPVTAQSPVGPLTGDHYPQSLLYPYRGGFQPRIGIAWRPVSGSSLVVRGGYGITQDTSIYQSIAVRMAQQSPLSRSLTVSNSPENMLSLANGFKPSLATTQNTFAVDPHFRPGYAQSWQIQVQRDFPGSLVMTATYLGIKGTHAQQVFLPNTYPAGAIDPCPSCRAGYAFLTSNGNSTKETGQFQLRRRLRSGFTATLQYTYAKAIDNAALGGRGQVIAQNWLDLNAERGLSSFDQRHAVTFQAQYTTGIGVAGGALLGGWRGTAFRDWTVGTQITAGTGMPLSPIVISAVPGTGVTGTIRPDYTGANVYAAPSGLFLNPAAYRLAASGQWGNAGRNSITGPSQFVLNASMSRTFRLRDRLNMDLRIDSQNTLNHVTFPSWNTVVGGAQFGLPGQANPMRSAQATVRVRF